MFENARLKLTAWYLLIIMTISVIFSVIIYGWVNREYDHLEKFQTMIQDGQRGRLLLPLGKRLVVESVDPNFVANARLRLITRLGLINLAILGISGAAGYFLAGRTLRPIKKMVDEQNRFIADASHELRTPLTSMRSEIEVSLRNKNLNMKDAKRLLESNLEEVVSLQTLSDSLLDLSQNGKAPNSLMSPILVSDSLDAALKKLEGNIKKKKIKVEKHVNKTTVKGIPDRITELFVILLDNALKYSPSGSSVTVTARKTNGIVRISVQDEGVGIHEDDLPHIFERFYRASRSRSKGLAPGYGLGLSIAKKIVTSHGGEISVESKVGKGTVFTIKFQR